jgi:hypothetical protein
MPQGFVVHEKETAVQPNDDFKRAELNQRLAEISIEQTELKVRAKEEGRDLKASESRKWNGLADEEVRIREELDQADKMEVELRRVPRGDGQGSPSDDPPTGYSPLLVSDEHMRGHLKAIQTGTTFGAVEERTLVTVATDTGSPGAWGAGQIQEPITLRRFAGIPNGELTGATAQMPSLTLPAGSAGVAESAATTEFNATDVVNLSTLRYGRWTEVTSFVAQFTDLQAINGAQAVGIARDLNLLDITAIQTAAGSVVAFDSPNLDRNVRQMILKVAAAVVGDPSEVVLFGTSAALGIVNGYAPASGADRGSVSTRVFGARTYVVEGAVAGNVYAFHPRGFKTFSSGLASATFLDPGNGSYKFGQWLHSTGPGLFIVGSAAGVDVLTP